MTLDLVYKDVKPTDELVKRLESKLTKLERIINQPPPVRFTLEKMRGSYHCVARFAHRGHVFVAEGIGEDLFTASDEAVHRLEVQVTNDRKKRQGKHREATAA